MGFWIALTHQYKLSNLLKKNVTKKRLVIQDSTQLFQVTVI